MFLWDESHFLLLILIIVLSFSENIWPLEWSFMGLEAIEVATWVLLFSLRKLLLIKIGHFQVHCVLRNPQMDTYCNLQWIAIEMLRNCPKALYWLFCFLKLIIHVFIFSIFLDSLFIVYQILFFIKLLYDKKLRIRLSCI